MPIAISPKHFDTDFPNGLNLDDKIELFVERLEGWQLGVAHEVIQKQVSHQGFAVLSIVVSYFEMIAKYRAGYADNGQSSYYFKEGVKEVFPSLSLPEHKDVLAVLYEDLRCGLYHVGMTRHRVLLTESFPLPLAYNPRIKMVAVNPVMLVNAIQAHLTLFAAELRDKNNLIFRRNFEKRFDYDNNVMVEDDVV